MLSSDARRVQHLRLASVGIRMSVRLLVILAALACSPSFARAQASAGAQSTLIDTSIRAAGMGRAGVAVFWGGDPNQWVNPALLAHHEGIRYEYGKTHLVPELASSVYFRSKAVTVGGFGIGAYMAGKPRKRLGGYRLDYGTSEATDVDGNPIGEFTSFEVIEAFGFGLSVAELMENLLRVMGADPPAVSRFVDVSLGRAWKDVTVDLAPAGVTLDGRAGRGESKNRDQGLLVRVTPYNAIDFPGLIPPVERAIRARIDVSYGTAAVNYDNNASITYIDQDQSDPFAKLSHWGWAIHADLTLPALASESNESKRLGWLRDLFSPLVSFGATLEHSQPAVNDSKEGQEIDLSGWELGLANVFTLRHGHVDDPTGTVIGDTSGWSLGLRVGKAGGIRYDHATVPQSIYLGDVDRKGFTVFLDPVRLIRRLR